MFSEIFLSVSKGAHKCLLAENSRFLTKSRQLYDYTDNHNIKRSSNTNWGLNCIIHRRHMQTNKRSYYSWISRQKGTQKDTQMDGMMINTWQYEGKSESKVPYFLIGI
jgi:hypothetical protein